MSAGSGILSFVWRRGKCGMLAWQHLTTANQRIKLAKRVLSLVSGMLKKVRPLVVYGDEENAACLHGSI